MSRDITAYYAFGSGTLDGEALQNTLGTEAPPIANVEYAASGGGVYALPASTGWMAGLEGQGIIDQDGGAGYDTAIGIGYGLVNAGYCVRLGPLRVYPLVGLGGGGIGFDLTQTDTLLEMRANHTNFLLHLGLGVELRIGGRLGLAVGLRGGYVFAPFGKREGIRGPYFRFIFGGSGRL